MLLRFTRLLIIISLPGFLAGAQSQKIDSLNKALSETSSDSVRIRLLIEKADFYEYFKYEDAKKAMDEAMSIAENKNWEWAKAECYRKQGYLSTLRGDYTSALKFANMSLPITIKLKDTARIASAYNYLGTNYFKVGEFDEAYFYFTKSFRLAERIKDSVQIAIALHNVGNVFRELGQYDVAQNHLELSQKLSEQVNDLDGAAYSQKELGDVYLQRGDLENAKKLLTQALNITRARKINILEPEVVTKLAELHLKLSDFGKANAYYDTASMLNELTQNQLGVAEAHLGKGKVSLAKGDFDMAMKYINETLAVARELNARTLEIECIHLLSSMYEQKGDFEKSLQYLKEFNTLRDTLYSQDMLEKLFQDQVRFETENKDLQIAQLSKTQAQQAGEIKRQEFIRNILVVVVALTVILLFTVYRSGQRRIRINKLLVEHQDEIKRRSIELEQLNQVKDKFFSIISHDLRSPINALSGILDLLENDRIKPEEFTRVTRELRVQFNHTKTLITNLLDWTLLQMDKLKIQASKIDVRFQVDENFKLLSALHLKEIHLINEVPADTFAMADPNMINLVFRNLILNGIKFTDNGGVIKVSSTEQDNQYTIAISDNGVGIAPEVQEILFEKTTGYSTRGTANEKGTGLGLILCKEFVERNGGKIWLKSEVGKGSTFYFTLNKFAKN